MPTLLLVDEKKQVPGPRVGETVNHLPEDVAALYNEVRDCIAAGALTAAVLTGRRLLMNVAATHGADDGKPFAFYVDYLVKEQHITPAMKPWVDQIRTLGNEATHELPAVTQEQAMSMVAFVGMLLKVVFEYPALALPRHGGAAETGE